MRYDWMDEYLMAKRGVTKDYQPVWKWVRYHIGGKMFAAILMDDADAPFYVNLKVEPTEGEFLRGQYADIIPGYYSDKRCWISVKVNGAVPDDLLRALLDKARRLVLAGMSKKQQREALGLSACGMNCEACPLYNSVCGGCNACSGKVFHAPEGRACPIYACAVGKQRRASCAGCPTLPCETWTKTRDPKLSDADFERSIVERINQLKEGWDNGI